jgi:transketolase
MYFQIAKEVRRKILEMNAKAKASHSGSALSIVDILVVLYFKVLHINPENPLDPCRDRFILSKGHASSALYVVLSKKGFFPEEYLDEFYIDGGRLPGHLDKNSAPGIEVSAGSLGHGLSLGIGMAIASKLDRLNFKVYVLCGDGELNEGSVWEGILFAGHRKLDNLTLIVDYNKLQAYGRTNEVLNLEPLVSKFKSFHWEVEEIDGHNFEEIEKALTKKVNKPKAIIAHTIKGKGISFMEDKLEWHYKSPNQEELLKALEELE